MSSPVQWNHSRRSSEVPADSFQGKPVLTAGPCHVLADAFGRKQKIWPIPCKIIQPCCQSSKSTSFFVVHFRAFNHHRSCCRHAFLHARCGRSLARFQLQNHPLCVSLIWLVLQSCSCPTDDSVENFFHLSCTRSQHFHVQFLPHFHCFPEPCNLLGTCHDSEIIPVDGQVDTSGLMRKVAL